MLATEARPAAPASPFRASTTAVKAALFGLPLLFAGVHLLRGSGFLLDDWFYLRNASFEGVTGVVQAGGDRPVGRLVYTVFYGIIGPHPAPMLLTMAAMAGTTAVLFRRLLVRFVSPIAATTAAAAWVVVPSHLSLETWPAVAQAGLAQLCAVAVLDVAARPDRTRRHAVLAVLLTVAALWSYESVAAVLLPGVLAVQWLARRRIDWPFTIAIGVGAAVAGLWSYLHWNVAREALETVPDLSLVVPANFAWPFTTTDAMGDLLVLSALAGSTLVFSRGIVGPKDRDPSRFGLVVAGAVVVALGTTPYVRYLYEPLGAGDRSNYLSAFGAAMVYAGLLVSLWTWRRSVAVTVGLVLLVLAVDVRWYRTGLWSEAAADGDRIARAVEEVAEPGRTVIVGPTLVIVDNITPFADGSTIRGAVQLLRGSREVDAEMVYSEEEFERYPESQRFDQRTIARLDEHGR